MRNPLTEWERHHLGDYADYEMARLFKQDKPVIGGWDTESTGLHIVKDKPFLIQFGWLIPGQLNGRVFSFHPTPRNMHTFLKLAGDLRCLMAWQFKFDLHMITNLGYRPDWKNVVEGTALARVSVEAVPANKGGDNMKLKDLCETYVHPDAGESERRINKAKAELKEIWAKELKAILKSHSYPLGKFKNILKDVTLGPDALPEAVRWDYEEWLKLYELDSFDDKPRYHKLYEYAPESMTLYAQDDIIVMLELSRKCLPIVKNRNQGEVIKRESRLIYPLYRMERCGLRVNRDFLQERHKVLKETIIRKRKRLGELAGEDLKPGQHARIKQLILHHWSIDLPNTQSGTLKKLTYQHDGAVKEFAQLIIELRTIEKWITTYCTRVLERSAYDGRFYGQVNQCGAVSGRVSADVQQFPRGPLEDPDGKVMLDDEGEELFNPRRAFEPTDKGKSSGYTALYYLD